MVAPDDSLPVLPDGRQETVQVGGVCEGCVSCGFTGWMDHYVRGRLWLWRCSAAHRRLNPVGRTQ